MRDDLSGLFKELVSHYNQKLYLLEQITYNETQLRYLVKSENTDDLNVVVQADNDLFVKLDALEFDIQSAIDKICALTGINKSEFKKFFRDRDDNTVQNVLLLIKNSEKIMQDLMKNRNELIKKMEESLKAIQKDITAINIIRKLKH